MAKKASTSTTTGDETPTPESTTGPTLLVEFFGPGKEVTERVITDKDFKDAGFEGVGKQTFDESNNWTVDFGDYQEAGNWLAETQPDFRLSKTES